MNRLILPIVLFSFIFVSCDRTAIHEAQKTMAEMSWDNGNNIVLDFEISELDKSYDLDLFIDHLTEYRFQNLYVKSTTTFPDGKEIENVFPVDLADKSGRWNGKCNSKKCNLQVFLRQDFKFKDKGKYKISIEQYSRENSLQGIENMRLAIFENEI